jgi:hypothetical protein
VRELGYLLNRFQQGGGRYFRHERQQPKSIKTLQGWGQ